MGRAANMIIKDIILRLSAKTCVFCWWDSIIESADDAFMYRV